MEVTKRMMIMAAAAVFTAVALGAVMTEAQPPLPNLPCVEALTPCAAYVNSTTPPPPSCCTPLMQQVATDAMCICFLLNDPELLMAIHVTLTEALDLAASCGVTDLTACFAPAPAPMFAPVGAPGGF